MKAQRELEIWGGIECSVTRVGERTQNQLLLSGHAQRLDDLERIAELGIRTLRYPILWETIAPDNDLRNAHWQDTDARMARLRALHIEPIVGLVHHGSGPFHTHLLDPHFATGLANFAAAVAQRYPWITRYTPVNEPLTTARFSGLYGLWYPHRRDATACARALITQCRGIVLAMQAVRATTPAAQLIQTEDLGQVFSSPSLAYQAEFENQRRWLTWDLLCGRVTPSHALWRWLRKSGIAAQELNWFRDHPCAPDVIGINHYVTSDRFLHEHAERFPVQCRGGNDIHHYADVEAVRVLAQPSGGFAQAIAATWQRYRLPIALTEVQLCCSRDEQLRWLYHAWQCAHAARQQGIALCAITPWALFGSFDWNTLLTQFSGHYESGAWDVRSEPPRRTAVADLIKQLATHQTPTAESWLRLPGWWQRSVRLPSTAAVVTAASGQAQQQTESVATHSELLADSMLSRRGVVAGQQVLILGAAGTLGHAFVRVCQLRGLPFVALQRKQLDIATDANAVDRALQTYRPWLVINATGYVNVDQAEQDSERCERENVAGAVLLARACARHGIPLVSFSSDLVFDGQRQSPYDEADAIGPLNVYGKSKARAEPLILAAHPQALVIRTSAFFGPWDAYNFLTVTLGKLHLPRTVHALEDVTVSPTYVPDLVNACLDLAIDKETGLWHLVNRGVTTWLQFARNAALAAAAPTTQLRGMTLQQMNLRAPRPLYSVLTSSRGLMMPTLENALERYVRERRIIEAVAA